MPKITLENGKEIIISQKEYDDFAERRGVAEDWRAEHRERYWYLNDNGKNKSDTDARLAIDDYRYAIGNYFKTSDEPLAYRDEQLANGPRNKAIRRVNARISELNDGWKLDWRNSCQKKWNIYYDGDTDKFLAVFRVNTDCMSVVADTKSKETVNQIIKEMEDDLRIIVGVEEN